MSRKFKEGLRFLDSIAAHNIDQIRVIEVHAEAYRGNEILSSENGLILYKIEKQDTKKLEVVFVVNETSSKAYSIYRTADEVAGQLLFSQFRERLPLLIESDPNLVNMIRTLESVSQLLRDKPTWTAAHVAAHRGYLKCFQNRVIQSQINMRCGDTQLTPLHVAVKAQQVSSVVCLVELGACLDVADINDNTALHYSATTSIAIQLAEVLLEHGCNINLQNLQGDTALHVMVQNNHLSGVILLLSHNAKIDIQNADGNTALHLAVKSCELSLVQTFITFGANVNILNSNLETPRHIAACEKKAGSDEILHALHIIGAERCNGSLASCSQGCSMLGRFNGIPPEDFTSCKKTETLLEEVLASVSGHTEYPNLGSETHESCRVLSLDGGGIRGLVLIQMLDELERLIEKPIVECFDLVAGTSTGGVLALLLASGKTIRECRCLYFRLKDKVFAGPRPYNAELLEMFLKKELGESTVMGDIERPRLMITATRWTRRPAELHIFRNYPSALQTLNHVERDVLTGEVLPNSREELLWKVARATGAAPTYFQASGPFIDGGLIANNPTLAALTEIHQCNQALIASGQKDKVCKIKVVLSMGTGRAPLVPVDTIDVFRPHTISEVYQATQGVKNLELLLVNQATQTDGTVTAYALAMCNMLNIPYIRLNPQLMEDVSLNETNTKTLVKMLWETTAYMRVMREELMQLKTLLV